LDIRNFATCKDGSFSVLADARVCGVSGSGWGGRIRAKVKRKGEERGGGDIKCTAIGRLSIGVEV